MLLYFTVPIFPCVIGARQSVGFFLIMQDELNGYEKSLVIIIMGA
jgi:hypothetical protein